MNYSAPVARARRICLRECRIAFIGMHSKCRYYLYQEGAITDSQNNYKRQAWEPGRDGIRLEEHRIVHINAPRV